jgi:NAD(P)-dependent dehydrogenase (short-subunit alcohol dehydrogenase family)
MASNQVALVTGASSGIGLATAELLAANGYTVFGTSRAPKERAGSIHWLTLDVRSDASVEAAARAVLEEAGRIDVLVNNAGYAHYGAIEESSIADIQAQLDTNLYGMVRMIQAVLPTMRAQGSGHIINISSVVGHFARPFAGLYATSKFALEGLSEALSAEVKPFGVDVALIEPGFVKTAIAGGEPAHPLAVYDQGRQATQRFMEEGVANGMEPGEVAQVILRAITSPTGLRYPVGERAKSIIAQAAAARAAL